MGYPVSSDHDKRIAPLHEIARKISQEVDSLRTMHLEPGETEPVDCTGRDLCGRVRSMAHLCQQLNEELVLIEKTIKKGLV